MWKTKAELSPDSVLSIWGLGFGVCCAAEFVFDWATIQKQQDLLRVFPLGGVHLRINHDLTKEGCSTESLGKRDFQTSILQTDKVLSLELLDFIKATGCPLYISIPIKLALDCTKDLVSYLCELRSELEETLPLSDLYFLKKLRFGNTYVTPLRPQSVMLTAEVYRSFEADSEKYISYGRAIQFAVEDFERRHRSKPNLTLIGAGRGGILLQAVENYQSLAGIVVVEKNIACRWLLESRLRNWAESDSIKQAFLRDRTSIFYTEIATFPGQTNNQTQWDIIVSEMLGCFGCDEQAPEVLFSIPAGLVSKSAIFIPASVIALLQPVQI